MSACSGSGPGTPSLLGGYPIAPDVQTTIQRTVVPGSIRPDVPKVLPFEVARYAANGYGTWTYGPGVASVKRLDLMPTNYQGARPANAASLLGFATISDIHVTDEETPAQAIAMGFRGGTSSGYSAVMPYTTQVLDAAVQTINALGKKQQIDFVMSLGDAIDDDQLNELRWYIDTLDGRIVSPDSGVKDDPIAGPLNDYQDSFKAAGLDPTIPWYQTLGNHDHFWMGTLPVDAYLRQAYVGDTILNMGNPFTDPLAGNSRGMYMGAIDGTTPDATIIGAGLVSASTDAPKILAADPDRRPVSIVEWMHEYFTTSSTPVGHGFTQANLDSGSADYSFVPRSDVPIKMIVLDDTQPGTCNGVSGCGHSYLDRAGYDWLVSQLDAGQAAGQLMIISMHEPIGVDVGDPYLGWSPTSAVTESALTAKLHTYPNLLALVAGHRHGNTITAFASPDPARPELGFWQIETSSLRDFPQQFRTFQVMRNSDGTVSILTTDVDPAVAAGSPAALSRTYAVATQELFKNPVVALPAGAVNAELVKQLSPEMQAKLQDPGIVIGK